MEGQRRLDADGHRDLRGRGPTVAEDIETGLTIAEVVGVGAIGGLDEPAVTVVFLVPVVPQGLVRRVGSVVVVAGPVLLAVGPPEGDIVPLSDSPTRPFLRPGGCGSFSLFLPGGPASSDPNIQSRNGD